MSRIKNPELRRKWIHRILDHDGRTGDEGGIERWYKLTDGLDLAFEMGSVEGMRSSEIKQYIRYIADWRLKQLKLDPIYGVKEHPLPWLTEILNGVEHANFFEARATEYSKVATKGTWEGKEGVWEYFDKKLVVNN